MSIEEQIVVKTTKGSLRGKKATSVRQGTYFSFQGIPFAKPPVGDLRFKAPVEAEPWTGIRDALEEGPSAPGFSLLSLQYDEKTNEDCLYLNVYTPKLPANDPGPPKAVLFWIHGGGFNSGSGNTDLYSPDYLVTQDVVVVTCNYRLGPLGFLSLQTPECPGNNGLKDIVLALKWCQNNISAFGGDPKNVTVFGESAGGAAAHYLLLSKKTEGLFHKVIAQSGVATCPWGHSYHPREAAFKLAEALGCKTSDERKVLEFLREASPEDLTIKGRRILKVVEPQEHFIENIFIPCVEPETKEALITKFPEDIYKSGAFHHIPFMLGTNTLEGLIVHMKRDSELQELKTDKELERLIPKNLNVPSGSSVAEEIVQKIRRHYFPKGYSETSFINALSSIYFLNGINQTIEYHCNTESSAPTFLYKFTYDGNVFNIKQFLGFKHWKGTCHGDELAYLFKQTIFDSEIPPGTKDFAMMEKLTKIWTDFAKTGHPMPEKPNSWPPISKNEVPYMEIDETLTQKCNIDNDDYKFWKDILKTANQKLKNCKL